MSQFAKHPEGGANRRSMRRGTGAAALLMLIIAGGWLALRAGAQPPPKADSTPATGARAAEPAPAERPLPLAPELDGGVGWLNTAGPIHLKDLRGKVVLLDFWTFCCINCMHVMPDLAKLEKKYPNQLVVIGVHSAKFDDEKKSHNIQKAILRYELHHPVVNDAQMKIWDAYRINAWPTFVLIDPEGRFVGWTSSEGQYDILDQAIASLIKKHRARKTLNERPLHFQQARDPEQGDSPLFFPGKVLADARSNRLFISDSTHHRIVITDLQGNKIAVAGTGQAGPKDGPFDRAEFNDPQGLALRGDTLYVADCKNHLIRALDLKAKTVQTIAGTGEQDRDSRRESGPGRKVGLNSPWALCLVGNQLYIAMAGHHQIWVLDLVADRIGAYAGMGREFIHDGPLEEACFAQPSGLTTDGKNLYVADSEGSAIRAVPLGGKGDVHTIVGSPDAGDALFRFGDRDGPVARARLQHCLGVAYHDGKLYVADTYNSKIKVIDLAGQTCTTLMGNGPGWLAGPLFQEPAGLSISGGKIYVADTNAHRIRVIDLKTKDLRTLKLQGVEAPRPATKEEAKR